MELATENYDYDDECPECGAPLVRAGGCLYCPVCGWSLCG